MLREQQERPGQRERPGLRGRRRERLHHSCQSSYRSSCKSSGGRSNDDHCRSSCCGTSNHCSYHCSCCGNDRGNGGPSNGDRCKSCNHHRCNHCSRGNRTRPRPCSRHPSKRNQPLRKRSQHQAKQCGSSSNPPKRLTGTVKRENSMPPNYRPSLRDGGSREVRPESCELSRPRPSESLLVNLCGLRRIWRKHRLGR